MTDLHLLQFLVGKLYTFDILVTSIEIYVLLQVQIDHYDFKFKQFIVQNMNQQQTTSLLFIQELNKYRLQLREQLDCSEEIGTGQLTEVFLKMQLVMYQNKNYIDLSQELSNNTNNLMRLINWEYRIGSNSNCFDEQKWNISFEEEHDISAPIQNHIKNFTHPESNQEQKFQRKDNFKFIQRQVQTKNAPQKDDEKKKPAQFISANSLPKGTSVRKKFVPPFKKGDKQEEGKIKQPINKDSDQMDPKYNNLQAKLVQIIQSQIVQKDRKVEWSQIAGLGFAKKIIHEMIVWPMLRPDIFTGLRAPPKGILLFGPPGTGKTMIGRAIASEAHATFFSISASSITSKWVGQSQKLVKTLFSIARAKQPSVIFIDEIDSLLCSRKQGEQESSRRVKTQFLVELDGAKTNNDERVLIIGATNLPQQLDVAVRRRFVKRLYIPLPNFEGRKQLINSLTDNISFDLNDVEKNLLSELTKGYSGADMYNLCSEASMVPLRVLSSIETIRSSEVPVTKYIHFLEALKLVRPSVNSILLQDFEHWNQQYGSYQLSPDELQKDGQAKS